MISKRLIAAVKLNNRRAYEIAHDAGIHPSTLSRIICGIEKVKDEDRRVIAVGKILGLSEAECFESGSEQNE